MRAPKIGSEVYILEKPNEQALADPRAWTVWSQVPEGWHIFHRDEDGAIEYRQVPARLLTPVHGVRRSA